MKLVFIYLIIDNFLKFFLKNKFKDIKNYNIFIYIFEIYKIIEFNFNNKLKEFMFN